MFEPLKVGEKVLIFYHPLSWGEDKYDIGYQSEGVVVARKKMADGRYWYKVEANDSTYTGLHCIASSDDYYFARKKEYIIYLRNVIEEYNMQKESIDIKKLQCRELIKKMKTEIQEENKTSKEKTKIKKI